MKAGASVGAGFVIVIVIVIESFKADYDYDYDYDYEAGPDAQPASHDAPDDPTRATHGN